MPTSSLTLYAALIVVPLALAIFFVCRGMVKRMRGEEQTDKAIEVVIEPVPPPVPFVPPRRIQPNRIPLSEMRRFDPAAQAYYDGAVANGRGEQVAWIVSSGYLEAARRRAQVAAERVRRFNAVARP